jgi:predicted dehydrogenase
VEETIRSTGNDRLMVGFNRRFAPLFVALKDRWGGGGGPQHIHYRVNAGPVDTSSWYAARDTEGSRFVGEGGHFLDTLVWWLDDLPVSVSALSPGTEPETVLATYRFRRGATGMVSYVTTGDPRFEKELFEAFRDQGACRLSNFRKAMVMKKGKRWQTRRFQVDKGQGPQMAAFVSALRAGGPMLTPWPELITIHQAILAAEESVRRNQEVPIDSPP